MSRSILNKLLGIYYLTQERPGIEGEGKFFKNVNEAILAYENGVIKLQSKIKVKVTKVLPDGTELSDIIESTMGRFIFNEIPFTFLKNLPSPSMPGRSWVR